ncbi:MAG: hypothetical protein ACIAXF_11540 [Phycisphaerales bacterium JB063]
MTSLTTLEKREMRLLRWEAYLRRTRHVAFWLGVLVIVLPPVLNLWGGLPDEQPSERMYWVGLFLFFWAYIAHLKVRHIESIKFHREAEPT